MTVPDRVQRDIHFYAADIGVDERGRLTPFDFVRPLEHIDAMPLAGDHRRLALPEDKVAYCWVDSVELPQKLRLANIRASGFPFVELDGNLDNLRIPPNSGLADPIHVVCFEDNVVGTDYNFYGPRMSGLQRYLAAKAPDWCMGLTFGALVDPDTMRRLNRYGQLRLFELRIAASQAHILRHYHRGLAGSFDAAEELLDGDAYVDIVLRPKPHSRGGIGEEILQIAKRMVAGEDLRQLRHNRGNRFKVQGIDELGEVDDPIDLLSDELIMRKSIFKQSQRSRALDTDSAYDAIIQAHAEISHKLPGAGRLYVLQSMDGQVNS